MKKNYKLVWLLSLCFFLIGISCHHTPGWKEGPLSQEQRKTNAVSYLISLSPELKEDLKSCPSIRVLLKEFSEQTELDFILSQDAFITAHGEKRFFPGGISGTYFFDPRTNKIGLKNLPGTKQAQTKEPVGEYSKVVIEPHSQSEPMVLNGNLYRGRLEIFSNFKASKIRWQIVNELSLEDYVAGSVGWEMIPSWELEALKAQAVAIRSYALFVLLQARKMKNKRTWDCDDTTSYLRYGGIGSHATPEKQRENVGVREAAYTTRGEILSYQEKLLKAFFHSNSGGHTSSSLTAFGTQGPVPLSGASLGEYGSISPLYRWQRNYSLEELQSILSQDLNTSGGFGALEHISPLERDSSGHIRTLKVQTSKDAFTLSGNRFRKLLGRSKTALPSTAFEVSQTENGFLFEGKGWGHGVGLDQWAAQDMAQKDKSYREILQLMYPETSLRQLWQ